MILLETVGLCIPLIAYLIYNIERRVFDYVDYLSALYDTIDRVSSIVTLSVPPDTPDPPLR